MSDALAELRSQVRSAALDHTLDAADRYAKLSALRGPIEDLMGEIDRYRSDSQKVREAEASGAAQEVLWARRNADVRENLLALGEFDAGALDEMGLLSHAELDRLAEEGLLEEAVLGIAAHWEEALHPRNHGQFASKPGAGAAAPHPRVPAGPHVDHVSTPKLADGKIDAPHVGAPKAKGPDPSLDAEHDQRQLTALADYLATKAEATERLATPALQETVKENGGEMHGLDRSLKSRASIISKLKRKRSKMPLATDEERAASITDLVRYTAIFHTDDYNQGVERTLGSLEAKGFKRAEWENYWGGADDYDGLHVGLSAPNGTRVELQFHTHESLDAKRVAHPIYDRFRESQDPHERWQLWHEMVDNAAKIPQPKGVAELGPTVQHPAPAAPAGA